jgi:folate-binding protein YgfZ
VLRIEAGLPAMGAELTDRTIPAEAGLIERAVSLTKGCYTGQELVARIDARGGHVPRHLRGVIVDGAIPAPGDALTVEGREVGTVTSGAAHPDGHGVGLAYVRRDVTPPAEARLASGQVARIAGLPLLS